MDLAHPSQHLMLVHGMETKMTFRSASGPGECLSSWPGSGCESELQDSNTQTGPHPRVFLNRFDVRLVRRDDCPGLLCPSSLLKTHSD